MIIFDVNYDSFLPELLSLTSIMIIFDMSYDDFFVLYAYVMYIISLSSLGNGIPKRKQTFRNRKKLRRLKIRLSGGVFFEKILLEIIHIVFQSVSRRMNRGSVMVMNR